MVKFFKQPEDTLAKAKATLAKAAVAFADAAAHAAQDETKHLDAISALADTITEKRARALVLANIAVESGKTSDLLASI